jgi:hypothetical protein
MDHEVTILLVWPAILISQIFPKYEPGMRRLIELGFEAGRLAPHADDLTLQPTAAAELHRLRAFIFK